MKPRIELKALSDDELFQLNQLIVEEVERRLDRQRQQALQGFEVGEQVCFLGPSGTEQQGKILRVNRKSITIKTQTSGIWRVAPAFVNKVKSKQARNNLRQLPGGLERSPSR